MVPTPFFPACSRAGRRTIGRKRLLVVASLVVLFIGCFCSGGTNPSSFQALAFSLSPYYCLLGSRLPHRSECRSRFDNRRKRFLCDPKMTTVPVDNSAPTTASDESARSKRQKNVHVSSDASQQSKEDPFLTLIPETVPTEITSIDDGKAPSSPKYSPLPSKLAYPFWYDPHPIAKWAADRLKAELPSYTNDETNNNASGLPPPTSIALGKMYGVLVVGLGDDDGSNSGTPPNKLGYLRAYSGTMPRPQYGGASLSESQQISIRFVPQVFDRFAKVSKEDGGDGFDYELEEETLNNLTREIERLESCPERQGQGERWKESEAELQKKVSDAKKQHNSNKRDRKARRTALRARLLANDNESQMNSFMNEKEAHICFLEYNEEYRDLEDKLVQESAFDQRQFKALKADLRTVQKSLEEHRNEVESLKQERKDGSKELQRKLFDHYKLLNVTGETKTPVEIFKDTPLRVPPSGTGDCAAIKLFQHAFSKGYRPIALAEFWWGPSPHTSEADVARTHGNYYPCCRGKCEPILTRHMLLGTDVAPDPLKEGTSSSEQANKKRELSIVYEDEWLVVVNKPHDVLSVPGRNVQDSIKTDLQKRYPNATGPLLVHRLDYSTSGLLLAAKDIDTHKELQAQFIDRTVKKRYTALLEGDLLNWNNSNNTATPMKKSGTIDLPLAGDYLNRPMQKVERGSKGKRAVTYWEIVKDLGGEISTADDSAKPRRTRIHFYPQTGRTHQLRVHASHPEGLGIAIVGDDIYGQREKRLCLHAGLLQINHPHTKERVSFNAPVPF